MSRSITLTDCLTADIRDRRIFPGRDLPCPEGELRLWERGGDVLAVCHRDYVELDTPPRKPKFKATWVRHVALDDRLGAWALHKLAKAGLKFDVLWTDLEEIGMTTAAYFKADKAYNWAFSFDRKGTDAVLYQYEADRAWRKAVESHFHIGVGSFSCIGKLQIGCCALNVGTGYYAHNSADCYADIAQTVAQIVRFISFYRTYGAKRFPWNGGWAWEADCDDYWSRQSTSRLPSWSHYWPRKPRNRF